MEESFPPLALPTFQRTAKKGEKGLANRETSHFNSIDIGKVIRTCYGNDGKFSLSPFSKGDDF